jgi:hypothetical protein
MSGREGLMSKLIARWGLAPLLIACWLAPQPLLAQEPGDDSQKKKARPAPTGEDEEDSDVPSRAQLPGRPTRPAPPGGAADELLPRPKRQAQFPAVPGARLTLAPGEHYRASPLHRMLMGQAYRAAWTTPIEVEVLDLRRFAGGLKPLKVGGGRQTLSLQLEGGDGLKYKFRTMDKDPEPSLIPRLRDTLAEGLVHDQISASHPGAPLMADGLARAAGLLYVPHQVFVMPDDESLGKFREQFGGQLGMIEPVVDEDYKMPAGFEGITKIIESDTLIERTDKDPKERVDVRSYLKGRLFDMFVGDWDRHQNQWEWVRRGESKTWEALALDRDLAFVNFDGFLPGIMAKSHPMLVKFKPTYPSVLGLAWNSRRLDRRLLGTLEREVFQEVARELQQGLTDEAIASSVRRLPAPWFALHGERFISTLRGRRDRLPEAAENFYRLIAPEIELHGTNADETVEVRRLSPEAVEVVIRNEGAEAPLVRRRLIEGETREVRLYLKGGDDRVSTHGVTGDGIDVRVAGGPGDDTVDDSQGGGTGLYDHEGDNTVVKNGGTRVNDNYWIDPIDWRGYPLRDWGGGSSIGPWVAAGADLGLLVGARWQHKDYAFRRLPYSAVQTLRAGYSTGLTGWKAEYVGDFLHTASHRRHRIRAMLSDIELVRFYGFGNETPAGPPSEFFKAEQRQYLLSPSYRWGSQSTGIWLGAVGKYADTKLTPGRFIEQARPYGVDDFGQVGPQLTFVHDTRDHERAARRGMHLMASGTYYPKVWSVDEAFAVANGEASTYLSPGPFTLALRAGGKKLWGDLIPFHEAAFIGGPDSVRGLRRNRFAGDASAFGNAELRLRLGDVKILVPIGVGVFGFGDIGRVWVDGLSSSLWHTGVGGGLALELIRPDNTVTVSVAWPGTLRDDGRFGGGFDNDRRARFYLHGGFSF